jgi:hypothetical protein
MKIPCYGAQHTKTTAGDHGLNRDGDAIVIRLPGRSLDMVGKYSTDECLSLQCTRAGSSRISVKNVRLRCRRPNG